LRSRRSRSPGWRWLKAEETARNCRALAPTGLLVLDLERSTFEVVMRKLAWIACLGAIGLGAMGATGCARFGAYCDEMMACEHGNDNDFDACEIELKADADRADNWGCTDEFDDLFLCLEEEAYCDGNDHWTTSSGTNDRCDGERRHYDDCCGSWC
jgi:hypothetical protein